VPLNKEAWRLNVYLISLSAARIVCRQATNQLNYIVTIFTLTNTKSLTFRLFSSLINAKQMKQHRNNNVEVWLFQ